MLVLQGRRRGVVIEYSLLQWDTVDLGIAKEYISDGALLIFISK